MIEQMKWEMAEEYASRGSNRTDPERFKAFLAGMDAMQEIAAGIAEADASNMAYEGYTYIARRIRDAIRAWGKGE